MKWLAFPAMVALCVACQGGAGEGPTDRAWLLERVGDTAVVQVYADGFAELPLKDKLLAFHLAEAAIAGRDIYVRQRCAEGLEIRELMEELLTHADTIEAGELLRIRRYLVRFWVNNSPYDNLSARKFVLEGGAEELAVAVRAAAARGARFPLRGGESVEQFLARLGPMLFDAEHRPMVTVKNPERGGDIVTESAVNFYGAGITLKDLDGLVEAHPVNSNLVRRPDGRIEERVWRAGDPARGIAPGLFAREIERIIVHLEAALPHAPEATARALQALIRAYRSGLREDWRAYDIAWVADGAGVVDTVNGFVEVYMDPRGRKGAWEGIVSYEDPRKARLIRAIAAEAEWFEAHMPFAPEYRKPEVKGILARSIDVLVETGDSGPVTPIGINLPNDQDVREHFGSKSVSIANIVEAYARSAVPGARSEFCADAAELERAERLGPLVADLHTNMHEVIGHASGRLTEALRGKDPASLIREHYSALEEARADLIALWFIMDKKLEELGLVSSAEEAALASYEAFTRNGLLMQLRRVSEGASLEEDHMRNRQMIAHWILTESGAILREVRAGKTFFRVKSAAEFRAAIGRLLALVQDLKSRGDYEGTKALFENHGIRIDTQLRDEVLRRYGALDVPSLTGFVMPRLTLVQNGAGVAVDVRISYPCSIEQQMLEWSGRRQPPE